jgi:hypothetical protein
MHPFDVRLIELERAQHGLVGIHQLHDGNDEGEPWSEAVIRHRARRRRILVARRVLANPSVGPSYEQRVLTGVLSAGFGAHASHETGARLWELPLPHPALFEITTADTRRPIVPGARMHRTTNTEPMDVTTLRGVPVSAPPRVIYSLSTRFSVAQIGRMTDDAVRRRIMRLDDLAEIVERLRPANGRSRRKMRIVLERRLPGVEDRESDLEDFVLAAIVRFDLPMPEAQRPIDFDGQRRRIDLCYENEWLALEAKGFRWYKARTEFDRDALRGNELQLAGFRVLSFTSAFTDLDIAGQIAAALHLPPPAELPPRTFAAWQRAR